MNTKGLECLYLLTCLGIAAPLAAGEIDGEHVVRAASGYKAERDPGTLREIGELTERRIAPEERIVRSKAAASKDSTSQTASAFLSDHWIYDAGVEMFFDADEDGYYRYLRVTFDVDSYLEHAWAYAALYLSADGVVWELLHETDDFRVDGETPDDAYEVETELVSGYPAGEYDLLIEIYDADTGVFQDELGPADTSAFALLPLEDRDGDTPVPVVVVHEHGGGGATSLPALLLLFAAAARRKWREMVSDTFFGKIVSDTFFGKIVSDTFFGKIVSDTFFRPTARAAAEPLRAPGASCTAPREIRRGAGTPRDAGCRGAR